MNAQPPGLAPLAGWLTVEDAARRFGMEAWKLRDSAVLAGIPKAYGPFRDIADSAFAIFIDEADAEAWDDAGRPLDDSYRKSPPAPPPPPQSIDLGGPDPVIAIIVALAVAVGVILIIGRP